MATEVVNVPDLDLQFFDNNGKPMASGRVVFFRNRTDIPESVYTSDGETALGNTIELDASGFPVVQFSLIADKKYTVKLFDKDDALVWTRNDIQGTICGGPGPIGDFIPMDGTTEADPVRGHLVWKEEQEQNSVSKTGVVLTNSQGGQTTLTRDGLEASIANTTGSHLYNKARIQNTQNGFPGYPDFAEMDIRNLKLHREVDDNGSRKEKSLNLSVDSSTYNTIESKGSHLNVSCDKSFIVQAPSGVVNLMGQNIELTPANNQFVYINNNGTLRTQWLSLGNNNYHQDVSEIYTSTSTGQPSDYQLITAKAALEAAGGSVTTSGGVQGNGTAGSPITLKLDPAGTVTLTQGVDGLKADYSADDEAAEYYSYHFTMTTHLLSRPSEMMIVPVHVDWSSNIRSVKFYNGTLGGASTPYTVILYHSVGDINTPGSYLEPFGYYYKSDSASDIVKGWNIKPLTFRGENDTWDETEYLATNGEEIFVGFWSRDSVSVPYIEGYADKAMGCEYTSWGSIPTLATVKTDIQVSNIYALASHIHIVLSSEEAP